MKTNEIADVIKAIEERDDFLIAAHVNPEGDSIGSQIAFFNILNSIGKKAVIVNQDTLPDNLKFLAGAELVHTELPAGFVPRTAIILDCPVKERIGKVCKYIENVDLIINVDHHVSNDRFGKVNWVEPQMSSAGEMAYCIIKKMGIDITYEMAEAIYTAIITDTGMFNYNNTTSYTHEAAGDLLGYGLNPRDLHRQIFENKAVEQIKLLGKVISTLKTDPTGKISYVHMTKEMQDAEGDKEIATDEFINFPRSIKGVEATMFFKEHRREKNHINVSFRSNGNVDVNKVASHFGGGGHKSASGCIIRSTLKEAMDKVLVALEKEVRENG